MRVLYYRNETGVHSWLCENIGLSKSKYAGHGWTMVNNFNRFARRMTSFWIEFDDWVTEEQLLAFRLAWPV